MAASNTRVRVGPNLYQRGDGRFVTGFTLQGRWTMRTLKARTKNEAKLEAAKVRIELTEQAEQQLRRPGSPQTIEQLARDFLAFFDGLVASEERAPRTADHYRWALTSYIVPAWRQLEVDQIGPDDVVALGQQLRAEGRGVSVVRAVEETTSRLFSFAVRRGYAAANPVAKLERGERAKVRNDDRRVLSHDEIARLLAHAGDIFEKGLLALLLYAGLRQGELLGLKWRDVDFEQGLLRLRQQLQRPRAGRPAVLAPLKAHSERDVVLVPQLAAVLREHRMASSYSLDEQFVFASFDGSGVHYSRMNRILKRIANDASVAQVSAHVFRRTFASHLIIDQRLDVVRVQRQLGHSRPSVTHDRYAFLFEQARHADELREDIANSSFAAILGAPTGAAAN